MSLEPSSDFLAGRKEHVRTKGSQPRHSTATQNEQQHTLYRTEQLDAYYFQQLNRQLQLHDLDNDRSPPTSSIPRLLRKLPRRKLEPASSSVEQRRSAVDAADDGLAEQRSYSPLCPATSKDELLIETSDSNTVRSIKANVDSSYLAGPTDLPTGSLPQPPTLLSSTNLPLSGLDDQEATPFRFAQLPPSLLDDAFHHRQRAAQLILLCSQDPKVHKTPLLHRLSLSLTLSRPIHQDRPALGQNRSNRHFHHHSSCDNACDTTSTRSDESDSDFLDLDICRSSHLGNKKKRKSSRSTSPTTVIASAPSRIITTPRLFEPRATSKSRTASPRLSATKASSVPGTVTNGGRLPINGAVEEDADSNRQLHCCTQLWSLPRQSRAQKDMLRLRAKIRVRLTRIILCRQKERSETEKEKLAESQTQRLQGEAAQASLSDKKPQKRMSKAEKRSQALRGSSNGPKAMSISAIRARAAASSSKPASASSNAVQSKPVPAAAPTSASSSSDEVRVDTVTAPMSRHASESTVAQSPTVSAPVAAFDFRMPSLITASLRELRSQVDAAPKELTDSLFKGDLDELSHAMDDVSLEPDVKREVPPSSARKSLTSTAAPPRDPHAPLALPSKPSAPASLDTMEISQSRKLWMAAESRASMAPQASPKAVKAASALIPRGKTEAPAAHNAARKHTHGKGCNHHSSAALEPYSSLFTADDWICIFCEYELYYGQPPLMLRACKSRKKLVAKKNRAKVKAKSALSGHAHHHHDHTGLCAHHQHEVDTGLPLSNHEPLDASGSHHQIDTLGHRDQCDCGNSIHDSDFDPSA